MVKIKVRVDGRAIGWIRLVAFNGVFEPVLSAAMAKAHKFDDSVKADGDFMARAMLDFVGPERTTSKAKEPVVTFQLVNV